MAGKDWTGCKGAGVEGRSADNTDPSLAGCLVHVPLMTPSGLHVPGPLEVNVCIP